MKDKLKQFAEKLLGKLFPPRLPDRTEAELKPSGFDPLTTPLGHGEHGVGKPRVKNYRDGIERYYAEGLNV